MSRSRLVPFLLVPVLLACAGDLVVRAERPQAARAHGPLGRVAARVVALPPVTGAPRQQEPVGRVQGRLGRSDGEIRLTEDAGEVLRHLVAAELRAGGHRLGEREAEVVVQTRALEFSVNAPADGIAWNIVARVRVVVRVSRTPDAHEFGEYSYSAERTGRSATRPGVRSIEKILGECLRDLAELVAEREALALALDRYGREG